MLRPVLTICFLILPASAPALGQFSQNRVHIGHDLVLEAGQHTKNAVCVLCSSHVEGPVDGDLFVFAGNAYIDSAVHGGVLAFGGKVTLTGNAAIGGRVLVFGGKLYQDSAAKTAIRPAVISPAIFIPMLLFLAGCIYGVIFFLRRVFPGVRGAYPPLPRF